MPIVVFFCGGIFIELWIGHEYSQNGYWVMNLLLIGLIFDSIAINSFRILMAKAVHGNCALVWLILSILASLSG